MNHTAVLKKLKTLGKKKNREGMARFGINTSKAFGVGVPDMRAIAKEVGRDRTIAHKLWDSGYHEARIVASMLDEPEKVTGEQMDEWALEFNSWDLCDQVIMNLFEKTRFANKKAREWHRREEEFVRRAGYVMMARLAVSDKNAGDDFFIKYFPLIKKGATDNRNFVKKAVNWAIRQIGKRNLGLNKKALALCREIEVIDSPSARWIAKDAIRELESKDVKERLKRKK
jgi:3-methyladenine DNA glycosylase AlkD